ncbi:MAG: AAA family ATPase [Alphaproteobacteria bacterium]|nr:AAA family ATPase [Alphaproteobacteria bacterium]
MKTATNAAVKSTPREDAEPFLAFVTDDLTRETLGLLAKQEQWSGTRVFAGGVAAAIEALESRSSPKLLVVDLTEASEPLADIHRLAEVCDVETTVIAVGVANDVQLFRLLLEAGVDDYLVKPVTFEAFQNAIRLVTDARAKPEEGTPGRLVTVVGARGGVGASTLAVNSAWLIAHEQKLRTALVDVDLQFGTVSLALDLAPSRGFREALENPERVDDLFVASVLVTESENLYVLGAEEALDEDLAFDPQGLHRMVMELRRNFECIVLDIPRALVLRYQEVLADSAAVAVVTDFSLAGMRDTVRLRSLIRSAAPRAKLSIIVNRARPEDGSDVPKNAFEEAIEAPVNEIVPYDRKALALANRSGKPVPAVVKNSPVARACREVSKTLSGVEPAEVPSSFVRMLKR